MEDSKILSKAPGYYYWVLGVFIYSFVYFFIFSVNKCLLKIANKIFFFTLSPLKDFWHAEAVPQMYSPGGGCSTDVLWILGRTSVHGVILKKLQKGFVEITLLSCCSPVDLLYVCGASSLGAPLEDCFWSEIILYTIFNLFFWINNTIEDFKVSVIW